jgi:hypothetical protein
MEMTEILQSLEANHERFKRRLAELRGDRTISDEYRAEQLREAYSAARGAHAKLTGEYTDTITTRVEELRRKGGRSSRPPPSLTTRR